MYHFCEFHIWIFAPKIVSWIYLGVKIQIDLERRVLIHFLVTFPTVFRVDILKREAIPSLHEKYGVENHDAN